MDFEFTMMNRTSIVVISGAISNSLNKCKVRKLEGRPLLLPLHERVREMKVHELLLAKKEIKRILKCKQVLQEACLTQLEKSVNSSLNNLKPDYIERYISNGDKLNVIVVWNGHSDRNILQRMGIDKYEILNITCYDEHLTKEFTVKLEKLRTKEIIFRYEIGSFEKNGRMLNLEETHSIMCSKKHRMTYAHDPKMDVRFTKCIFNMVLRKQGYTNLIKYFN
ncbi:uncharacterized protein LOC132953209 [Metopolophium dirhodum]|uniref:uncharacterized protein LOC132935592 n=1 Tax=Metopolophium dirhodum TaxID=44670 RepID=UPI00298FBB57|nr:uncharacterized protein LOC132935592 [Metopolophium dirhodum]XP_060860123.1 uncharacterized protein LOC132937312 [Metopolophium dirhodum]XP_060866397.1 uncharacterized protein LOC132942105 [Metopolophium dirhodum]XP_060875954.1 uncharacterized protein LOC132949207 [Metopolophium dirhodum]XP_060881715.1 uncharacterized protein LOC132953209 [Metopolophium dirhodum]